VCARRLHHLHLRTRRVLLLISVVGVLVGMNSVLCCVEYWDVDAWSLAGVEVEEEYGLWNRNWLSVCFLERGIQAQVMGVVPSLFDVVDIYGSFQE
jgi:hypothetical protein